MTEQRVQLFIEKLCKLNNSFVFKSEGDSVIVTYLPYDLEFVYVPSGIYNKGLSFNERVQARKIDESILFEDTEMEYNENVFVQHILVTRTPILNAFAARYVDVDYFKGEENYAAYLKREQVDLLCNQLKLRLPTETEWEYFVRAGSKDLFAFGSQIPKDEELEKWLNLDFSNLENNNCNAYGLYGLYTGEWCSDIYRKNRFSQYEKGFVIKGGGAYFWPWQSNEWIWCMSAMRMSSEGLLDGECGVRLVYDLNIRDLED